MENKHTPTPYYAIHGDGFSTICNSLVVGQKSSVVARIKNDVSLRPLMPIDRANAEFIVRACNAHDDLVEALKLARDDIYSSWGEEASDVIKVIEAALNKAEAA